MLMKRETHRPANTVAVPYRDGARRRREVLVTLREAIGAAREALVSA